MEKKRAVNRGERTRLAKISLGRKKNDSPQHLFLYKQAPVMDFAHFGRIYHRHSLQYIIVFSQITCNLQGIMMVDLMLMCDRYYLLDSWPLYRSYLGTSQCYCHQDRFNRGSSKDGLLQGLVHAHRWLLIYIGISHAVKRRGEKWLCSGCSYGHLQTEARKFSV
jgi:hypothetical protein